MTSHLVVATIAALYVGALIWMVHAARHNDHRGRHRKIWRPASFTPAAESSTATGRLETSAGRRMNTKSAAVSRIARGVTR